MNKNKQEKNHTLATLLFALCASTALIFAASTSFVSANGQSSSNSNSVATNTIVSSQASTNSNANQTPASSSLAVAAGGSSQSTGDLDRQPQLQDMLAAASSNHQQQMSSYDQQQQMNNKISPSKAKKIQIVYIKVPLAKLKPSLPANDYSSSGSNSNSSSAYENSGEQLHDTSK